MPEKHDPFDEPGCHDCPAGGAEDAHIIGLGATDNDGLPVHPKNILLECHVGPKHPLYLGKAKDGHPIVDRAWPQMNGDEICFRHPALVETMDPESYGEEVGEDDEDEEDEE